MGKTAACVGLYSDLVFSNATNLTRKVKQVEQLLPKKRMGIVEWESWFLGKRHILRKCTAKEILPPVKKPNCSNFNLGCQHRKLMTVALHYEAKREFTEKESQLFMKV